VYVFRIGPVPGDRGELFVLVALDETRMAEPVTASTELAALKSLQRKLQDAELTCEPALAEAADALKLATAPVPEWVLPVRAAMALGLAMGPLGEAHQDVETMIELVDVATRFLAAAPWERFATTDAIHVTTKGALSRRFDARVVGEAPGEAALVLYEGSRDVGARRPEDVEQASALALRIDPAPDFLAAAGLALLPLPMRLEGERETPVDTVELLALLAAADAVATLSASPDTPAKATQSLGPQTLTAEAKRNPKIPRKA
jgi:hypothetical protein